MFFKLYAEHNLFSHTIFVLSLTCFFKLQLKNIFTKQTENHSEKQNTSTCLRLKMP